MSLLLLLLMMMVLCMCLCICLILHSSLHLSLHLTLHPCLKLWRLGLFSLHQLAWLLFEASSQPLPWQWTWTTAKHPSLHQHH